MSNLSASPMPPEPEPAVVPDPTTDSPRLPKIGSASSSASSQASRLCCFVLIGWALYGLSQDPARAANIRDIFIIFLALMSMLVVVALVLIALTARLVLMLQNEVTPLLMTIDETLRTIRGTTVFMSDNVVNPVVKASSFAAGARRFLEVLAGVKPRR
jgi:hypothetical protein